MDSTSLKEQRPPSTTSVNSPVRDAEWRERLRQDEMERRRQSGIMRLGGIVPFTQFTFESFNPDLNGTHRLLKVCREFDPTKGNLMMIGPVGVGKTHLMVAMAHRVFDQGGKVRIFSKADLIAYVKGRRTYSLEYEMLDVIKELVELDFLGIDDIEDKPNTETASGILKQILSKRYDRGMHGACITTNKLLGSKVVIGENKERVGDDGEPVSQEGTLHAILGPKVADRIDGMFSIIVVPPETKSVRGLLKRAKKTAP